MLSKLSITNYSRAGIIWRRYPLLAGEALRNRIKSRGARDACT